MGEGNSGVDLLGDPILARREGPGRPAHVWTREISNRLLLSFWCNLSVKQAATAVGLSVPTVRKVYFAEVAKRNDARLRLDIMQLARLNDQAVGGNVTAEKELSKRLDALRMRYQFLAQAPAPRPTKRLGKKEQAEIAAREVGGLYEPRPAPNTLN